jgi:hypothetical protein
MSDELPPPDAAYFGDHPATRIYADAGLVAIAVDVHDGIVVRPGDVLVVDGGDRISQQIAATLRDAVLERMPGLADVVVLSGVNLCGVYRADEVDT